MKTKLIHESDGQCTFVIALAEGDEAMACLKTFSAEHSLSADQFTAIGAFKSSVISYFDWETKSYENIPVAEQTEVASLTGDVFLDPQGKPAVHAHVVLGKRDGSALAGHFTEGHVRPTLEIILTESPAHLRKQHDPASGLALLPA